MARASNCCTAAGASQPVTRTPAARNRASSAALPLPIQTKRLGMSATPKRIAICAKRSGAFW
ncbi:hypothetical protein ASC76_01560 [Rhizobacter sp. Root404]|nr:hypothetical protein ASC76_01560 [Rhizobacter sp. Root404]